MDGFGNAYFMDDANVPSLLALPYFGYVSASDPVYLATRSLGSIVGGEGRGRDRQPLCEKGCR